MCIAFDAVAARSTVYTSEFRAELPALLLQLSYRIDWFRLLTWKKLANYC